jgi:hypothetical protein
VVAVEEEVSTVVVLVVEATSVVAVFTLGVLPQSTAAVLLESVPGVGE